MKATLITFILFVVCATFANGLRCYYCSGSVCPYPFYTGDATIVYTNNRYCAKKSNTADPMGPASRGVGDPRECTQSGCWTTYDYQAQKYVYLCCCSRDLCNTGSFTSKSTLSILLGALTLLAMNRYF